MNRMPISGALLLLAGVGACVARPAADAVPTLSAGELARTIEADVSSYQGRMVRVCGKLTDLGEPPLYSGGDMWNISQPADPHPHGASVDIVACSGEIPRQDQDGCLTGRIAFPDGTLDPSRQPGVVEASDEIRSSVWVLHSGLQRWFAASLTKTQRRTADG